MGVDIVDSVNLVGINLVGSGNFIARARARHQTVPAAEIVAQVSYFSCDSILCCKSLIMWRVALPKATHFRASEYRVSPVFASTIVR